MLAAVTRLARPCGQRFALAGYRHMSTGAPRRALHVSGSAPFIGGAAGAAAGLFVLGSANVFADSAKERSMGAYENRLRAMSTPEKLFKYFASVKQGNEYFMTPEDFIRSLTPYVSVESEMEGHEKSTPRSKSSTREVENFFRLIDDGDGLMSFTEYIFFVTLLAIPEVDFKIAFSMFDLSGDGCIDKMEFEEMMRVMRSKSPQAKQAHRSNSAVIQSEGILKHFFGKDGKKSLSFDKFADFLRGLHRAVLKLEFDIYDVNRSGYMSPKDFCLSMIAHVHLRGREDFKSRALKLPSTIDNAHNNITFQQFLAFDQVLKNLDDIHNAIKTYGSAKGKITPDDFMRASRAVAGVELHPVQVDVIFWMFDRDGDGHLADDEFLAVMQGRRNHGLDSHRDIGFMRFGECLMSCVSKKKKKDEE